MVVEPYDFTFSF